MYQKIINPYSGRKVSIFSKTGKNILKNYLRNVLGGFQYFHYKSEDTGCTGQILSECKNGYCVITKKNSHGNYPIVDRGKKGHCKPCSKINKYFCKPPDE